MDHPSPRGHQGLVDRGLQSITRFTRYTASSIRRRLVQAPGKATDAAGPIFARAKPQSATIVENYRYTQEISANPTHNVDPDHEPVGTIKVVVPYDGDRYFGTAAVEDVRTSLTTNDQTNDAGFNATIGHLLLTDARDAQRLDGGRLAPVHGAIPLIVPVSRPTDEGNEMRSDQEEAVLEFGYRPPDVSDYPLPLKVVARLLDPDDAPAVTAENPLPGPKKSKKKKAGRISWEPISQVAFSSELQLEFVIHLYLPRRSADMPVARIKRVALHWPTITSLEPNFLRFEIGAAAAAVQYDPASSCLVWRDLDVRRAGVAEVLDEGTDGESEKDLAESQKTDQNRPKSEEETDEEGSASSTGRADPQPQAEEASAQDEEDPPDGSIWHLESEELRLFVRQPGQLRSEETLTGEIEVDVEELLSGIDARVFDACGRRHRKGTLKLKTRLKLAFTLYLADEFDRRLMKSTHTLQFDEIVPGKGRIDDITSALRDRGFSVDSLPVGEPDPWYPSWALLASRNDGPNTIKMLLLIHGRHQRTERRAQSPGHHRYTSKMRSGELRITIHGEVPRSSTELTYEVNKLRESLGERFLYVQDQH